ncbi:hypothetical protein [Caenibacillus caldisaponilyticus]|uniref:hypothetical protein n=1 Tax=Caenibacillus caldisaponilyticus TaxID=1674942 RepID=UPI00098864E2|nr:hypothetical protein [Caenibacillus caldisaponilyticus]
MALKEGAFIRPAGDYEWNSSYGAVWEAAERPFSFDRPAIQNDRACFDRIAARRLTIMTKR